MLTSRTVWRSLFSALLLTACFAAIACTPKIPNKISAQEMDVYREWLKQHFANHPPGHLYLDDQTFAFDPLHQEGCGKALYKSNQVSNSLMRELHNLGTVDYGIDLNPRSIQIPWSYQVLKVRDFPKATEGLHVISFSRVAFDSSGREALFAVNDLCGSACGSGHAISAAKETGAWKFKDSPTCAWKY